MNNKLRIAALSIAAAFICSTTGDFSYEIFNGNNTSVSDDHVIARELSAEIVSANQTAPVIEQLSAACKEKNTEEITHICDKILDEMDAAKEEVAAYAIDINEWASDEIKARQEKYENELNVKYAQTAYALNELRNGIDYEKNLEIISGNFTTPDEYHRSDAAPNTETSAKNIEDVSGSSNVKATAINSPEPTEDDLKYDGNTEIPELITALAESLGDVNSIYLFVKNNIRTEPYTGSKKGALITLSQFGGNDLDQAAILIALLRAINIPARYVTGTVQITPEQALEITGADNLNSAGRIIASGFRNARSVSKNGEIVGYKMTRTWVEAYIPYTDYRGAGNMSGDKVWVQLDPSFKKLESKAENVDADFSDNDKALIETLNKASAENKVAFGDPINLPDKIPYYYNEIKVSDDIYIPSSLPYTPVSVDERYSFIKGNDKDTISISVGYDELLTAPVSELYGKSVIVDFEAASSYDQDVIDKYEKLTDVPAYLVNVVPVVTVGSKKYKGTDECSLGSAQEMVICINEGGNSTMLNDSVYSGSVYAINLDLQKITQDEARAVQLRMDNANENYTLKNSCTPEKLGAFLDFAGTYYFSLCDLMDGLFAAEMNIDKTRRLGLAITGYQFARNTSFGSVRSLDDGSFYIDVSYNSASIISLDGNRDNEKTFTLSTGSVGSYFEGYIWEKLIDESKTCISTISVMNAASKKGIDFRYLNEKNADAELAECNIKDSVKNEIRNFINQGFVVEAVPETLTIGDWTGTAYIAIDMDTGSASYMISGGTAGGSSMVFENSDFEDLFRLNEFLFLFNVAGSLYSITDSVKDTGIGIILEDKKKIGLGIQGVVSGVHSLISTFNKRYESYDFIFEYALDEDEEIAINGADVMFRYSYFTLENIIDSVVNTAFIVANKIFGYNDEAKEKLALLKAGYSTVKYLRAQLEKIIVEDIKGGKLQVNNSADLKETIYDWAGVLIWQLL